MSNKSVYAIAISEGQANQIVDSLTKSGPLPLTIRRKNQSKRTNKN